MVAEGREIRFRLPEGSRAEVVPQAPGASTESGLGAQKTDPHPSVAGSPRSLGNRVFQGQQLVKVLLGEKISSCMRTA